VPHRCRLAFVLGLALACASAYAAGLVEAFVPATAAEGLLFGLTHPLTGVDHTGALVAVATLAAMLGRPVRVPLLVVPASLAGVRLYELGVELPLADELLTGLSAWGFGLALVLGRPCPPAMLTALLLAAGLAHGYAYGEHVAASSSATFLAAVVGLAAAQATMVVGVFRAGLGCAVGPAGMAELGRAVGGYGVMTGTIALLLASA
jgi:urease accessory protein